MHTPDDRKNATQAGLTREIEKDVFEKFNTIFALICLITFLVFYYLVTVRLETMELFLGSNGLIVGLTLLVCILGYFYGYYFIKDLITKIVRLARESQEKDYLKTIFISVISHDLRNFLGAISLSLQNIKEGYLGPATERQIESLNGDEEAIRRVEYMTTMLLDITRMETGIIHVKKQRVSARELVDAEIEEVRSRLAEKNITVERAVDSGILIMADKERLGQAIGGLLRTAAIHSPVGKSVHIRCSSDTNAIRFEVMYEGEVIPTGELQYLFEGFSKTSENYFEIKESGLDLSLARCVVNLHGGTIWTEAIPGAGFKFAFTIPHERA